MATVSEILQRKDSSVFVVRPIATVLEAAERMNERKIGCLAVVEHGKLVGIITERDLLTRVIAGQRDPTTTSVAEVMTADVVVCGLQTACDELRDLMRTQRIRHIPVQDDDEALVGLVSMGDLNAWQAHDREQVICGMENYIAGRT